MINRAQPVSCSENGRGILNDPALLVRALPIWRDLKAIEPLKGGVSNASFVVEDAAGKAVARVGHDYPFHQVDRNREIIASRAAARVGLSPDILYAADGVSVIRYINGRTFGEDDVRQNWRACLALVQRCHLEMGRQVTGQGAIFWVFQILRDYGAQLVSAQHRFADDVPQWMAIVDELEAAQVPMPIVFGHHDLLPGNFMDDGTRPWLIDWEYGAFGTAMFDLANLAANNSFDAALENEMLAAYFTAGLTPALRKGFSAMKAASALREALWGLISELHLKAPGVDYVAYAAEYLARFNSIYSTYKANFSE
jgi:thiamine kinase-like enzyme